MMGGFGAPIAFGGVWGITTGLMVLLMAFRKRWDDNDRRSLVLRGSTSVGIAGDRLQQAASDTLFVTMFAGAYLVYRFKRWWRGL
jgi:hypothetical protein